MSRIGKQPIEVPAGVKVEVLDGTIKVEGPKGKLARALHPSIKVEVQGNQVLVTRPNDEGSVRSLHGLTRSLINNMVLGVTKGYERGLHIEGVGYRAAVAGKKLNLTLGYSHPVEFNIPDGITIAVEAQTELLVSGVDKELVGQVAANIRFLRKPEPYRGKGIRYKDEVIRRKAGKTATTGAK
ncbi:MAG: 50S ribosomal protein L6 [candidate division FCPU426 bacterium]